MPPRSFRGGVPALTRLHLTGTAQSGRVWRWRMWFAGIRLPSVNARFDTRNTGKTSLLNVFTRGYFTQV